MSEIKRVKIQNFVDTQIPEFLNSDSPLFKEFLTQYYISQEYQTGIVDLANNITKYKSIDNFNNETFFSNVVPCVLSLNTMALDDVILVNHTVGFPDSYGLLKIDNEIITYTGKTSNSFTGCVRGFSGIDNLKTNSLTFTTTEATSHLKDSEVQNLTALFFNKLFEKFKYQFLPGFENRNFVDEINIKNILSRAKDFYASKGTDTSYKILFKILFNEDIEIIKPQEYTLKSSSTNYIVTKKITLEKISGGDPFEMVGKTLFQGDLSSASVYNVEIRPVEDRFLYEVSLDTESITFPFESTKKTNILKQVFEGDKTLTVDSTVGFPNSGEAFIVSKLYETPVKIQYQEKTLTQLFGVSGIDFDFDVNDEVVSNNFAYSFLDDGSKIEFRVLTIIDNFDLSKTSNLRVKDKISLSYFGEEFDDFPQFNCWQYNIPIISEIKSISGPSGSSGNIWTVNFYDKVKFYNEETILLLNNNDLDDVPVSALVIQTFDTENKIQVQTDSDIKQKNTVKRDIAYAVSDGNYFSGINSSTSLVQNTYADLNKDYFYVASSGLPYYPIYAQDRKINTFTEVGSSKTTVLNTTSIHKFYTGEKIYYFSNSSSGISSGIYFVNTIGDVNDSFKLNLASSKSDLFNKKFIELNPGAIGESFVKLDYENKILKNQKILKKFNFKKKESIFEEAGDRSTNNRTIGLLSNGVEIYSPTLYDENLYYGKLDSILITDKGKDYDIINYSPLVVEDEIGFGASAHLNLIGSLKEVKIVRPGIGYEIKPKITLTGGNGTGAVVEPNLVKSKVNAAFRGDGNGVNTALNIITFTEPHNFNNCEEVIYDSNGNVNISYEEEVSPGEFVFPKLSDGTSYFAETLNSTQVKLYRTKDDCVSGTNPIQFRSVTNGIHYLRTLKSKNTITKVYVKNPGSGYSNKKVVVNGTLSADNLTNGINTFDDYVFAKNHNFNNKDLVKYSYEEESISGLSTTTLYAVTVLDKNKFRLSETGYEEDTTNLLKYSQNFDNGLAWQRTGLQPIVPNFEIAPDGTKTADLIRLTSANSLHNLSASVQGNIFTIGEVFTLSVFVKKFASLYRYFQISGAGSKVASPIEVPVFDLNTGTVVTKPSTNTIFKDAKMEYYGNGWYRCSVTYKSNVFDNIVLEVRNNSTLGGGSFVGSTSNGFYLWGAQVEPGPNLSSYVSTFDRIRTRGIIEPKYDDYTNQKYVKLNSVGSGYQTFSYPPIKLRIEVQSGITSSVEVEPILDPVVIGPADSTFIIESGEKYGTSDIINFHRRPNVSVSKPSSIAQIKPVIIDGKIIDVQILSQGANYTKGIDILISDEGSFAELYAVVENGKIVDVKVLNGGINYTKETKLTVLERGSGTKFIANVNEWKINQIEKNKDLIDYTKNKDEAIIVPSKNSELGLQFVNFYPPKELRKELNDNISLVDSNERLTNLVHSPIIGWAYDGNPIYGPYGQVGSEIKRVETSYLLNIETNNNLRPDFPDGFFVQDYAFVRSYGDLDEYNGRFCITPDFPEGTYAYFYTIDDINLSNPLYPYVIASETKDSLIEKNYDLRFNQEFDISTLNIVRNVSPYYINSNKTRSIFLNSVDKKYQQEFSVSQTLSSSVESLSILSSGNNYKISDQLIFDNDETFGSGLSARVSEIRGKNLNTVQIGVSTFKDVSFIDKQNTIVGITSIPHDLVTGDIININGFNSIKYKNLEGSKKIFVNQKKVGLVESIPSIITGFSTSIAVNDVQGFETGDLIKIDNEVMRITNILSDESRFYVDRISGYSTHAAGISSVILLPNKFSFTENGVNYGIKENKIVFFDPTSLIGIGTTGSNYTDYKGDNIRVPQKSIFVKNHNFTTGQELTYNIGPYGNGLLVSDSTEASSFRLVNNQKVYAVNYGPNYLGISTVGFTSSVGIGTNFKSLFFYKTGTTGKTDSLKTNYELVNASVENYYLEVTTLENHQLNNNDFVRFNINPNYIDTYSLTYDLNLRKIVTNILSFPTSAVNFTTSEIEIESDLLKTGQKIVYYSTGLLSDLVNNETYYVIKTSANKIRLANSYYDALEGNYVSIYSSSVGINKIGFINPPIKLTKGSSIKFDLSDPSLSEMDLKFYKDINFIKELEDYKYNRNSIPAGTEDSFLILDSDTFETEKEIYYNLISNTVANDQKDQISSDIDVMGRNKISIISSYLNDDYEVVSIGSSEFRVSLKNKPENMDYSLNSGISSVFYSTTSLSASGPIQKLKINYQGKGYKKLPNLLRIQTENGTGASIKPSSTSIGKIDSFVRVKDGYDYPTDNTLRPYLSVPTVATIRGISRIDYVGITTGGKGYNSAPYLKVVGNDDVELSCNIQGGSVSKVNIIKNVTNLDQPLEIIPTKNTNGYDIENITVSGSLVTLELVNSDEQIYPLIANSYGGQEIDFPFSIGDEIFVENCRISLTETDKSGAIIIKDNYNSSDYGYKFFKVTGISTVNYTVTYDMTGYSSNLGPYINDFGYGYVTNKKVMAKFDMKLIDDLNYFSEEEVLGFDEFGTNTFSAKVLKDGWDGKINQIRLTDSKGILKIGNKLLGEKSQLNGTIENVNTFNIESNLGVVRDNLVDSVDMSGTLNDYQQRISDNDYYQKFSYSIRSQIPYSTWREPVKSVIHPAGFKEFSDLNIISTASTNMKMNPIESDSTFIVNIDSDSSVYRRNNFTIVTEDPENQFEDGSIERIEIGAQDAVVAGIGVTGPIFGIPLKPYILNKTNKVANIDDISNQFNGSSNYEVIGILTATFSSYSRRTLGISTLGLEVGDYVGFSSYIIPDLTYITSVGINSVNLNIPHNLLQGTSLTEILREDSVRITRTIPSNEIIGITSFKLTENNIPFFYRQFNSSDADIVDLTDNIFNIENHNFQVGQKITYFSPSGSSIGIATTSAVEDSIVRVVSFGNTSYLSVSSNNSSIITKISGGIGSALYENGYNVSVTGPIVGTSASVVPNFSGNQNAYYGYPDGYPQKSSSGIGTGAKFSAFIVYNSSTGQPISTSVILNSGGSGYKIGDTVSISGTFFGGSDTTNDLSFTVSKVSSSRIPAAANNSYLNISSTNSGFGTNAKFNVYRNSLGDLSKIEIVDGGVGYALTDRITILGSNVGGTNIIDDIFLSPVGLGTNKLPSTLYINQCNDDAFKVSGLPTERPLDINSLGIGTHAFEFDNANASTLIVLDNIIQSPVYIRDVNVSLASSVAIGTDFIFLSSGITSITSQDIFKINQEFFGVKNIGIGSTNSVQVIRGFLGTVQQNHSSVSEVTLCRGNFNIVKDVIHFAVPPYGKIGPEGLQVSSSFQGRVFSRKFDPGLPNDKNIILDDISQNFTGSDVFVGIITGTLDSSNKKIISGINTSGIAIGDVVTQNTFEDKFILPSTRVNLIGSGFIEIVPNHNVFTGIATTSFNITRLNYILKSNKQNVVGLYTNTNSSVSVDASGDINNNPIILINNIPQVSGTDYIIDTSNQNTFKFISGIPNAGRIVRVGINSGFGYQPLVGASATVTVSAAGTISSITLTGSGSGYRIPPVLSLNASQGIGASFSSSIGAGGTITALAVVNAGSGYTSDPLPNVLIDLPSGYSDLPITYVTGTTGDGEGARVSVVVGSGTSIVGFELEEPGFGYKVGDVLSVVGITTRPGIGASFSEFRISVEEIFTDKFSGFYPGQFIQFDDISQYFNGVKKKFSLTVTENGIRDTISLKVSPTSKLNIENNLFVYINDILQQPVVSYKFSGSRIVFNEPPRKNSKCTVLFYKGSDLDVEQVDPPKTIKSGDTVIIEENILDPTDRAQFERVVKTIISTDAFDTFTYNSIGINTDLTKDRPLTWIKQTQDRIINGTLQSKSRPDLKSRVIPSSQLIKNVSELDSFIYVDNAFPIFSSVDGLKEELSDIVIVNERNIIPAIGTAIVSSGTSISEISINSGGFGYFENTNPDVSISSLYINKKDPIYNWQTITPLTTNNFNSVTFGNNIVSVGQSGLVGYSSDATNWNISSLGYGSTISFNSVVSISTNKYVSVGDGSKIISFISTGSSIIDLSEYTLSILVPDTTSVVVSSLIKNPSDYSDTFNDVIYSPVQDKVVAVGNSAAAFVSVGIGSDEFLEQNSRSFYDLLSVANSDIKISGISSLSESRFVAVGKNGTITISPNGEDWFLASSPTTFDLNKIIWDGSRFVAVGDNGTIVVSDSSLNWNLVTTDSLLSENILNIRYYQDFYVVLTSSSKLYYSFDLIYWLERSTNQPNKINDLIFVDSFGVEGRYVGVGDTGTLIYAEPVLNRATATSTATNGIVDSVTIVNPGFGYSQETPPPVIFSSDSATSEKLVSCKVKGDFGNIVNVSVASSTIVFELKTEFYDGPAIGAGIGYSALNAYGVEYSQLERGDYFVIFDSSPSVGHALTCIDIDNGGLSNYPDSIVGTATTYLDGVYRVSEVIGTPSSLSGITTVRCHFAYAPGGGSIIVDILDVTNGIFGKYSWSKLFDYENRAFIDSKSFSVNTNNGLSGLSTAPKVYRTRGLI